MATKITKEITIDLLTSSSVSIVTKRFITISGTILLSQLEELSKALNVSLLLNGRSPRIDRKYECSRIDVVIPT